VARSIDQEVFVSRSFSRRSLALLAVLALGPFAVACSDDDSSSGGASSPDTRPAAEADDATDGDTDGDLGGEDQGSADQGGADDADIDVSDVITADGVNLPDSISREHVALGMSAALKADRVDYVDGEFRVYLSEGSKDDPVVIGCIAVKALLEEGETATLIFPDGELDCSN